MPDRPDHIRALRHGQGVGLVSFQTLPGFNPEVQFLLAVDAVDPFVVPAMPLHIA